MSAIRATVQKYEYFRGFNDWSHHLHTYLHWKCVCICVCNEGGSDYLCNKPLLRFRYKLKYICLSLCCSPGVFLLKHYATLLYVSGHMYMWVFGLTV